MNDYFAYFFYIAWPLMCLSLFVKLVMDYTFKRFSEFLVLRNFTGRDVAERILTANQLSGKFGAGYAVKIEPVAGHLTDSYSPKEKVLRLSDGVYNNVSIAAVAVAAHECGHALQDANGYIPNKIRNVLVPVANIGSKFGPYIAVLGVIFTYVIPGSLIGNIIFNIGILGFFAAAAFYLITLPVEINASRRAIAILRDEQILTEDELSGVKKVLIVAALTYFVAAAASIITLLRLVGIGKRWRR